MTDSMNDMLRRLIALQSDDHSRVSAIALAVLAKRLITHEVRPGGPYTDESGRLNRETNRLVARLFTALGINLPNVTAYVNESAGAMEADGAAGGTSITPVLPSTLARPESEVMALVTQQLSELHEPLRHGISQALQRIKRIDTHGEISELTACFVESLRVRPDCDEVTMTHFGVANVYAWIAYSLYDDFIDGEGAPAQLPVANVAHRLALQSYERDASPQELRLIARVFTAMDEANAWEVAYCRAVTTDAVIALTKLPDYDDMAMLARRAGAHIVGPLLVSYRAGATLHQRRMVRSALNHYLIARQLNDDLHDWADDLAAGHLSPVVTQLLAALDTRRGTHDLQDLKENMQRYFWERELNEISENIVEHCQKARQLLAGTELLIPESSFMKLTLDPIERSAQKGMETHANQRRFFHAYAAA